jgi:hypothetical protein
MAVETGRLYTELGLPSGFYPRKNYLDFHMDRRNIGIKLHTDNELFFPGNKVYFIDSDKTVDKSRIGTILNKNKNEEGSLGEPTYQVEFKNVDGSNKQVNPSCHQYNLVLRMPGEMQGGKNRKISKKYRKSKHRKSKHRKSKHRKSKHQKSKKSN